MLKCGLLGEHLSHSYSPAIHAQLGTYSYGLFERTPDELGTFLRDGEWDGLNVTIPYKKAVVPFCTQLSDAAKKLGSVNTIVRCKDGSLYGDNTDYYGFSSMVRRSGIAVAGKKALVLGNGGASVTICAVLQELGARSVTVISRRGEDNYTNLDRHADAQIIVNTTPVGMYPNNGAAAVDLQTFAKCEGVFDIVYNPARTALIMQAENLHIPCVSGLHMLVAQAKRSSEIFTGGEIDDCEIDRVEAFLRARLENIVLIGMPGCGKSTVAKRLGTSLGRKVYEADAMVEEKVGMPIPEIFCRQGEAAFRAAETQVLEELGKLSGAIISTGGGCVTRAENYPLLHQNGRIFWLQRSLEKLSKKGRPLSQQTPPETMYAKREPLYAAFADAVVDNNASVAETVRRIEEEML